MAYRSLTWKSSARTGVTTYAASQSRQGTEKARHGRCQENQEGSKEHRIVDAS